MPDTRKLYALTFAKDHHGPAEMIVSLPNGGRKAMSLFQKDEKAPDYPYVEMILEEGVAAEQSIELAMHGLALQKIAKPKHEPDQAEAPAPPPTSETAPVAVPPAEPTPKKKAKKE